MAIFSTLRSRQMTNKRSQAMQQMIGFRLDVEWFALPILAIYKVIPLGKVYGDPQNTGVSLTTYEGKEILVIDVVKHIFNRISHEAKGTDTVNPDSETREITNNNQQRYLLILQNSEISTKVDSSAKESANFIGLPIDSAPTMYRVANNALKPLPKAYLDWENIQCVSSEIVELADSPPLFVLDSQKLMASIATK